MYIGYILISAHHPPISDGSPFHISPVYMIGQETFCHILMVACLWRGGEGGEKWRGGGEGRERGGGKRGGNVGK